MTFTVFGLTGYPYGLMAGLSALCYLGIAVGLRKKTQAAADTLLLYGVLGVPLGLVFARLFFCTVNLDYYLYLLADPLRMLAFWDGGFSVMGLLTGLVLAAALAARLRHESFMALLDAAVLPLGVLLCGLRLAEGLTEVLGVGRQVDVSALAQRLPVLFITETMGTMELYRLAVFRYEAAFSLILFGLSLWFAHAAKRRRAGDLALLFFALFGAGQVLFESMRDDGHMVLGFVRVQQVLSILAVLSVLAVLCRRYGRLRGARDAVTAAWAMLPLAAMILIMMLVPVNHVLDLTGHIPLGAGLLAAIGLYLAFFLRIRGANPRLILIWIAALLLVAACVMLEFSMDASGHLLRDYTLLALCCAALFVCPYSLYRTLTRQEAAIA